MALNLPIAFENSMRDRLKDRFDDFKKALENTPPVSIRLNHAKGQHAPGDPVIWSRYGRYLPERPVFTLDPRFHAGAYYVQEASSMFLEQAVEQTTGNAASLNVLDLCAAPGGKSTHLLSLMPQDSLLVSNEVIRSRAGILVENITKWGNHNCVVTNNDPADFQRLGEFFDVVVLDAPCSGEGLFRKDPDARGQWSAKNIELCSLRQRRIVHDIWPVLKPGGILIYSTCTYNDAENTDNMRWLKKEFDVEFVNLKLPEGANIDVVGGGDVTGYQFFPHRVRGEGFFLSVLKKKGSSSSRALRSKDVLKSPAKTQMTEFSDWIQSPDSKLFFLHNQTVRMFPILKKTELQLILQNLNVVSAGTAILEIMKNKFVPDHALALSVHLNTPHFERIDVDEKRAIQFLRKDPFDAQAPPGFALIEFEGLGLGWVNILQNRVNNLYPSNWRIRMGHQAPSFPI